MTRTQIQLPDTLYDRTKNYADFREISMAEVCRNALEMFISIHEHGDAAGARKPWRVPVCRSTGLVADPFADEDWRLKLYEDHD